jgi:potassium-transporting ATPase ATP-binding subunit
LPTKTFSLPNDLTKYFAIVPAASVTTWPALAALNIMHPHSPQTAILSSVIFNPLIIIALIPLALKKSAIGPNPRNAFCRVSC